MPDRRIGCYLAEVATAPVETSWTACSVCHLPRTLRLSRWYDCVAKEPKYRDSSQIKLLNLDHHVTYIFLIIQTTHTTTGSHAKHACRCLASQGRTPLRVSPRQLAGRRRPLTLTVHQASERNRGLDYGFLMKPPLNSPSPALLPSQKTHCFEIPPAFSSLFFDGI